MPTFSDHRHTTPSSRQGFPLSQTALAVLSAFGSLTTAAVDLRPVGPTELPQGGQITAGKGAISASGNTMDIRQQSQKLIANWQSFNIGSQGTVNFVQPGASATALNRIVGQDATQIYGRLNANGQVFLVNPNGVLFGRSASVNVGGLTASTLNITDENFLAGRYLFERNGAKGKVENLGTLTAADGGYLALLAPEVRNEGALIARMGTVAMAAGDKVTLEFSGSRLTSLTVDPATMAALIDNKNLVDVGGGQVIISTAAANQLLGATVNNEGIVSASSLTAEGGRIVLRGDLVRNIGEVRADGAGPGGRIEIAGDSIYTAGRISADGSKGGDIRVTGNDITTGGLLSAVGSSGSGGQVLVAAAKDLWQTQSTQINASGVSGGTVTIDGGQQLVSSASIQSDGSAGAGGAISVTADFVQLLSANVQANGETAGGQLRVGGEWQGGKGAAVDEVRNAQVVAINDTTRLSAKANSGTGGEVVVWSDQRTTMLGQAEASGTVGKGGRIEVSSAGELTTTARLNAGSGGQVLLDPKDLIIDDIATQPTTTATQYDLAFRVEGDNPAQTVVRNINGLAWGGTADAQPSVALSQPTGTLVIGSPKEDTAYIYHIDPDNPSVAGGAALLKRLFPTTDGVIESGSRFGESVAIDRPGQYVAVGAPSSAGKNGVRGTAYVYKSVSDPCIALVGVVCKDFKPVQQLYANGSNASAGNFGLGVALSGEEQSHRLFVSSSEGRGQIYQFDEQPNSAVPLSLKRIITALPIGNDRIGPYVAADSSGNLFYNFEYLNQGEEIARISPPYDGPRSSVTGCHIDNLCGPVGISADGKFLLFSSRYRNSINLDSFASLDEMDSSGLPLKGGIHFGLGNWVDVPHLIPKGVADYSQITGVAVGEGDSPLFVVGWSNPRSDAYGGNVVSLFRLYPGTGEIPPSVTSQRFRDNPSETNTISATAVRNLLATGAQLTLQANNDLTVKAPVTVNNPSGNGGDLTLQAGRSVLVNASITTDNGNLKVVANEANANETNANNGVFPANRGPGPAVVTMNGTIDAGTGTVSMTIASGEGRTGNAASSGDITLGTITAGRITAVNEGPSGGNIVLLNNAKLTASGSGDALVLAAASGGYFVNKGASVTTTPGRWLVYSASADPAKNTFGNLISDQQPLWNRSYSPPPTVVTETGNRYLFKDTPTVRVAYVPTVGGASQPYDGIWHPVENILKGEGQLSSSRTAIEDQLTKQWLKGQPAYKETTVDEVLEIAEKNKPAIVFEGKLLTEGKLRNVLMKDGNVIPYDISYSASGGDVHAAPTGYLVDTGTSGDVKGIVPVTITPAPLQISTDNVVKTYDGTVEAPGAKAVVVEGQLYSPDQLRVEGNFAYGDKNAGMGKEVVIVGRVTVDDGNGGHNYQGFNNKDIYRPNTTSTIDKARLTVNLAETQCRVEDQKDPFQYSFTGFKNAETAEQVVNGTPTFSLDSGSLRAGAAQPLLMTDAGTLSATNYEYVIGRSNAVVDVFPGAALAYTVRSQSDTALRDASSAEAAQVAATFVADKTNNARFVSPESVNVSSLAGNGAAFVNYVGARYADRQERFSSAISMLETNPSLADLAQCKPGDAPETLCIPAVGTPQFGANPAAEIQRKVAYLFANQAYDPKKGVDPLSTPYSDTEAIGKILQDDYGYEVNIVRDATRRDLILTLKKAAEAHARDESIFLYYAGHGIELRERQSGDMMGYWLPVDANARDPRTWVSNADIGKFMQLLPAKQVMLVSDSCFSGRLAVERKIEKGDVETRRAQLLAKRAVTVMSSGNFEEVDDAGKGDHSIFAWSLIEQLNASVQHDKLVEGNDLFTAVRARIHAEKFPQTPQYSALLSSGYEPGGDFFLERR